MAKKKEVGLEEEISKNDFYIQLFNDGVDTQILESFRDNVEFFDSLKIKVTYHRRPEGKYYTYYIKPHSEEHGTIGYRVGGKQ